MSSALNQSSFITRRDAGEVLIDRIAGPGSVAAVQQLAAAAASSSPDQLAAAQLTAPPTELNPHWIRDSGGMGLGAARRRPTRRRRRLVHARPRLAACGRRRAPLAAARGGGRGSWCGGWRRHRPAARWAISPRISPPISPPSPPPLSLPRLAPPLTTSRWARACRRSSRGWGPRPRPLSCARPSARA